jgi:hypothetical protein
MRVNIHRPKLLKAPLIREAAIRSRLAEVLQVKTDPPAAETRGWEKISYDAQTAKVVAKVRLPCYAGDFSGLINFSTGEMHLREATSHEKLAMSHGLKADEQNLQSAWFGFRLFCHEGTMVFDPKCAQFGAIPIQHAPLFEASMKELFSGRPGDQNKVWFLQLNYQRTISRETISRIVRPERPVAASLSDADLIARYPGLLTPTP